MKPPLGIGKPWYVRGVEFDAARKVLTIGIDFVAGSRFVVAAMLKQWCTNVLRSEVAPMKDVARMVRRHFDGIVAWTKTHQTNGFIEALNGLFQAPKRKARGYTRFATMRTVLFLIAGKLDFTRLNPHAA